MTTIQVNKCVFQSIAKLCLFKNNTTLVSYTSKVLNVSSVAIRLNLTFLNTPYQNENSLYYLVSLFCYFTCFKYDTTIIFYNSPFYFSPKKSSLIK